MDEQKCEIGCLSCGNNYSVNNGEEEVNFRCPVCALKTQLAEKDKVLVKVAELLRTWLYISANGLLSCSKDVERETRRFFDSANSADNPLACLAGAGVPTEHVCPQPTNPEMVLVQREDLEIILELDVETRHPDWPNEFWPAWKRLRAILLSSKENGRGF